MDKVKRLNAGERTRERRQAELEQDGVSTEDAAAVAQQEKDDDRRRQTENAAAASAVNNLP